MASRHTRCYTSIADYTDSLGYGDVSGWSTAGIQEKEEKEKRERVRREARATWEKEAGPAPGALWSRADIDKEAVNIRQAMEVALNAHAKKRRVCVRSKAWWTNEIAELRKKRGRAVREKRQNPAAYGEAQRTLRRAIRRAKKSCWEEYVQGADKEQLWKAVRYTAPRLEGKAQTLVDEAGAKATNREERERMLIATAFPEAPDVGEQTPLPDGGRAHQRVNESLVGRLLAKTRNASAPGGDKMGAEIVKVMWEWAPARIATLVRAYIELGHHPKGWKTAKGVVIAKPGKPDYTQVRAHRVISLLDSISKLVERT